MSLVQLLVSEPGKDCKNEWLLPKILRANYVLSCIGILLLAVYFFARMVSSAVTYHGPALGFLKEILLAMILIPSAAFLALIWARLVYEIGILLFRMFEAERDIVEELSRTHADSLQANQYICDRLAEISEGLTK